jgi:hypothetical protein
MSQLVGLGETMRVHYLSEHLNALATRNVSDFADTGISLVNPWAE